MVLVDGSENFWCSWDLGIVVSRAYSWVYLVMRLEEGILGIKVDVNDVGDIIWSGKFRDRSGNVSGRRMVEISLVLSSREGAGAGERVMEREGEVGGTWRGSWGKEMGRVCGEAASCLLCEEL